MAAQHRYIELHGDLQALLGVGQVLVTVSVHPEGRSSAVSRINTDKATLEDAPLPAGGVALVADEDTLYVAGTDGHVYRGPLRKGPLDLLGSALLDPAPRDLALLARGRLAALSGAEAVVLSRKDGKELQRLPLPGDGTVATADPTGTWLVAGTKTGSLAVFECEDKDDFVASEDAKVHEGQVTALLFERDELRVLSIGADQKLLTTHVRGHLEPDDRGGRHMHDELTPALADGPGERFYTAGDDQTVKSWTHGPGRQRPATTSDCVARTVALSVVEHKGRPHLAAAGRDTTLRLFPLDAGGKVGEAAVVFYGAHARARHELESSEVARREAVLRRLAEYGDAPALDRLAESAFHDADHGLKVLSAKLLGGTGHPRAGRHLEKLLKASAEAVRRSAFEGLRRIAGEADRRVLELALATRRADVGLLAVEALAELAARDDQAHTMLAGALEKDPQPVRFAALETLEKLADPDAPDADVQALTSKRADLRRRVAIRFYERGFLDRPAVQMALRRLGEDPDADVRSTAFLASVLGRPKLALALRSRDPELHRRLHELESSDRPTDGDAKLPKVKKLKVSELGSDDYRPLLEAMASRALDTCLQGTWGLALLGDTRAFGALLQLSRDPQAPARVEAAKALRTLGDPRATDRLRRMLYDEKAEVRDAAFTALARLGAEKPLETAEAGLGARHVDVRRRALQLLVRQLKKQADKAPSGGIGGEHSPALALLARALNDSAAELRSEALKSVLNLGTFAEGERGAEEGALRFALGSLHSDLRGEVLVEVEAQIREPWAWLLLLELFEDPDPGLRGQAFELAVKKSKGRDLEPLATALRGRYDDLRVKAAETLTRRHTEGAHELLVEALGDHHADVRRLAVKALSAEDDALRDALKSPWADVRLRAAVARAGLGDAEALAPLAAMASQPRPDPHAPKGEEDSDPDTEVTDPAVWQERVETAIDGLRRLALPEALTTLRPLVDHDIAKIRRAAVRALAWCSRPDDVDALRGASSHADENVRTEAAFGLAVCGDPAGAAVVFASGLTRWRTFQAAVGLGDGAAERLLELLDDKDSDVRKRALRFHLMAAWAQGPEGPARCLAMLSSAHPRVRLTAARALETITDRDAFSALVVEHVNDRGDHVEPWTLDAEVVLRLAGLLVHDDPQLRVRAVQLLAQLDAKKQERFARTWRYFERRFGAGFGRAPKVAAPKGAAVKDLAPLVFGAYVGLARLGGDAAAGRIRRTAIARLLAMASAEAGLVESVRPVLVLALADDQHEVRRAAFEGLRDLGVDKTGLGAEALASPHHDVGVLGLELLAEAAGGKAEQVLRQVMLQRGDGLEIEALRLLGQRIGDIDACAAALESPSAALRNLAVRSLGRRRDSEGETAVEALRMALSSRFSEVRFQAAESLAERRDADAFDVLVELLGSSDQSLQRRGIAALAKLGDERGPDVLMDRVDHDPDGSARIPKLLRAAGAYRQPATFERLSGFLELAKTRRPAFDALLAVSGHDQKCRSAVDTLAWKEEIARQHPRHDDVLKRLIEVVYPLSDEALLLELIEPARVAESAEVGVALAPLAAHPKDAVRCHAVGALGWRLSKRDGAADALVTALGHTDPNTRFLAAEGLALGGRSEGLNVLLASADLVENLEARRRAVHALGKLADTKALDLLLRLADEEGHALQEDAAEALGHMSKTEKADEVFAKLSSLTQTPGGTRLGVASRALRGLRWFGSHEAWELILSRAEDIEPIIRITVAHLLGRRDEDRAGGEPGAREALEKRVLHEEMHPVAQEAARSLRRLWGDDSLEPDYVIVRSPFPGLEARTLERLAEGGDAARLLGLLAEVPEEMRDDLAAALMERDPLPVEAASECLESSDDATVVTATRILGQAGVGSAGPHGEALAQVTAETRQQWIREVRRSLREEQETERLAGLTERLSRLIWACGRLTCGAEEVVAATSAKVEGSRVDGTPVEPRTLEVRRAALRELARGLGGGKAVQALEAALESRHAELRTIAAEGLGGRTPERAADLAASALDDPGTLASLHRGDHVGTAALQGGLGNVHTQGIVLPYLLRQADVTGLAEVARDRDLPETARLGALEGLGRLGSEAAEAPLVAVGSSEEEEEALRKAAWRALRRSRRLRARREATA